MSTINHREKIINMYFIDKLKPIDISKNLNLTKSAISQILAKDSRYKLEKEERKKKNKNKHIEDTKILIYKKRKALEQKNNMDDLILKNMHCQASIELSKPKTLSNMSYRNWNKSAYTYNHAKKRFEFRMELGKSNDVPKYIKSRGELIWEKNIIMRK